MPREMQPDAACASGNDYSALRCERGYGGRGLRNQRPDEALSTIVTDKAVLAARVFCQDSNIAGDLDHLSVQTGPLRPETADKPTNGMHE